MVVSIDPKRVYVTDNNNSSNNGKTVVRLRDGDVGPNGEQYCWWQVTVKGGRETRDLDAVQLAKVSVVVTIHSCQLLLLGTANIKMS